MTTARALVVGVLTACAPPESVATDAASGDPDGPRTPGCGLEAPAFCERFDAPAANRGRAGDLDPSRWSAAHGQPAPARGEDLIGILPAPVPACREGLASTVAPGDDAIVCAPSADIASAHLLVAVAAQNYGQSSFRIRQPFDFAARTGRIMFDAEGVAEGLLGWVSIEITEDPSPAPSFAMFVNDEGGAIPRDAIEVQFQVRCHDGGVGVRMIDVIEDLRETRHFIDQPPCVATKPGALNHFEITISEQRVEVYGTPYSPDGTSFGPAVLLAAADVSAPFTRGYVHITTHNHATRKYGVPADSVNAWIARWDNVGFDGPLLSEWREYEVPHARTPSNDGAGKTNIAYLVADPAAPANVLELHGIDLTGVTRARLVLNAWYLFDWGPPHEGYRLAHRWNGGPWRERGFTSAELARIDEGVMQSQMSHVIDVDLAALRPGTNRLELAGTGIPTSYPPVVGSIDLVLD